VNARVAVRATLAAIAVAATSLTLVAAGCEHSVPVGEVVEVGTSRENTRCELDAGDCGPDLFCEGLAMPGELPCHNSTGICVRKHPSSCDDASAISEFKGGSCGCDGVSYYNGCVRAAAGQNEFASGACENQPFAPDNPRTACGPLFPDASCPVPGSACALLDEPNFPPAFAELAETILDASAQELTTASAAGLAAAFCGAFPRAARSGNCWVLPSHCVPPPDAGLFTYGCSSTCTDVCSAIEGGGPVVPCEPSDAGPP
jgi:hypothetical protein